MARERIEQELAAGGGQHLVFVHYAKYHSPHDEWVYNRADIDAAPVVWAREVDPVQDSDLRRFFCNRHVWRVDADRQEVVKLRSPACEHEE